MSSRSRPRASTPATSSSRHPRRRPSRSASAAAAPRPRPASRSASPRPRTSSSSPRPPASTTSSSSTTTSRRRTSSSKSSCSRAPAEGISSNGSGHVSVKRFVWREYCIWGRGLDKQALFIKSQSLDPSQKKISQIDLCHKKLKDHHHAHRNTISGIKTNSALEYGEKKKGVTELIRHKKSNRSSEQKPLPIPRQQRKTRGIIETGKNTKTREIRISLPCGECQGGGLGMRAKWRHKLEQDESNPTLVHQSPYPSALPSRAPSTSNLAFLLLPKHIPWKQKKGGVGI